MRPEATTESTAFCPRPGKKGIKVKRVRIATDSIADIPEVVASELDIAVVPCLVDFGQEVFRDGVDLTPREFFDRLSRSETLPRTSQPPVQDFVTTYRRLLDEDWNCSIISIHAPGRLSGIVNAAWSAAQMLPEPSLVEVIDSGQISMGMGWAVIEAARLARNGASHAEVAQAVRDVLPRLRTVAMIDALDNLRKGGRISLISAALGAAFQIKPLLSIRDGEISVLGKVRTRAKALERLVWQVQNWGPMAEMAVLHTGAEELVQRLTHRLQDRFPIERMVIRPAGAALSTHLGLGAVGVCALAALQD